MSDTNPVGRPTKYDDSFPGKVDEYLLQCRDEIYEFQSTRGEKSDSFQEKIRVSLPTYEGLSKFLGVNVDTLYEWKDKYPKFSESLSKVKSEQKNRLLNNGLSGTYNPTIAKLILASNHNMRDKQDITTDGKELPTPIMKVGDDNPDVG